MSDDTKKILDELRQRHGTIDGFTLEDGALVVLRKPTAKEYLEAAEVFSRFQYGERVRDPQRLREPLLACVVHGAAELRAAMEDAPALDIETWSIFQDLAGAEALAELIEAPELVTEQVKAVHGRALGFRVGGQEILLRRLDGFEWVHFRTRNTEEGANALRTGWLSRKVLAETAELQVIEDKDKDGRKPKWEALQERLPAVGVSLGLEIVSRAAARTQRIQGK